MSRRIYKTACAIGRPIVTRSVRCVLDGLGNLPEQGGALLAPNHESYFDAMILSGLCPRPVRWLSAVGRLPPPVRVLVRALDVIPLAENGQDTTAVRATVTTLRGGNLVGTFPEGAIPNPGQRAAEGGPLQAGVFKLARLAGVPVIPCAIIGSSAFGHWRGWIPGSGKSCAIVFGGALSPREETIVDHYREAIAGLLGRGKELVQ